MMDILNTTVGHPLSNMVLGSIAFGIAKRSEECEAEKEANIRRNTFYETLKH